MFSNFSDVDVAVQPGITIHGRQGGSGPALLLLHGFPQTHHMWHRIADDLATRYTVVALDLRGYGTSSKPAGSDTHVEYAKSTMARDCVTAMSQLGHARFFVCAHDRGARVAHKLCVDHPDAVVKAIFLDICPTLAMYRKTDMAFATAYFHWFFLIQKHPIPETLMTGHDAATTLKTFLLGGKGVNFHPDALAAYVAAFSQPAAVHGMCEDYRAAASVDLDEAREDIARGRHVRCPLRVLYGSEGVVGRMFDVAAEWKEVHATGEVECFPVESGHYIPEERPEVVRGHILEFLVE